MSVFQSSVDRGNNTRRQCWIREVARTDGNNRQERDVKVADWKGNRSKTEIKMKKKNGAS